MEGSRGAVGELGGSGVLPHWERAPGVTQYAVLITPQRLSKWKQNRTKHNTKPILGQRRKACHWARFLPWVIGSWSLVYKRRAIAVKYVTFPFLVWIFPHSQGHRILTASSFFSFVYLSSLVLVVPWADKLVKTSISTRKASCIWTSALGLHYWLVLPNFEFAVFEGEVDRRGGCHFLCFRRVFR